MRLKAKKISSENFSTYGTILDPYNCGEPINPGTPFPYFNDRMPITFAGGSIISLNVQIIKKTPLEFDTTEAHDFTEELVGGYATDLAFHVGPADPSGPDFSKFEAFILPKHFWIRLKRGVYHECPFIIQGVEETLGWCILPPYTAYNDSRLYKIEKPIKIIL